MARLEPLAKFILSFEGGFVNDPRDRGGATNRGITLHTWKAQGYDKDGDGDIDVRDLKLITEQDATNIMRKNFWNRWRADEIKDQSLANLLVDWVWASGKNGIVIPQKMLGVKADGIVGPKTLAALDSYPVQLAFKALKARRLAFVENIVKNDRTQGVFLKGWKRRINAINYGFLIDNKGNEIRW